MDDQITGGDKRVPDLLRNEEGSAASSGEPQHALVFRVPDISRYSVSMKIAMVFTVSAVLLAASAAQGHHKLSPDGKEAIPYVKMAADIALNVQQVALNNFLAVYVSYRDSDQAGKDGDLGPFMKIGEAEPHGGWSAVCFFSAKKDVATCVYFDEKKPFGVVSVKAGSGGKLADPSAAYHRVTLEMRKKSDQRLDYVETTVTTDYGAGLTGFQVTVQ